MPRVSPIRREEVEGAGLRWQDQEPEALTDLEAEQLCALVLKATGFQVNKNLAKRNNAQAWADAISCACSERRAIDRLYGMLVHDQKGNPAEV